MMMKIKDDLTDSKMDSNIQHIAAMTSPGNSEERFPDEWPCLNYWVMLRTFQEELDKEARQILDTLKHRRKRKK